MFKPVSSRTQPYSVIATPASVKWRMIVVAMMKHITNAWALTSYSWDPFILRQWKCCRLSETSPRSRHRWWATLEDFSSSCSVSCPSCGSANATSIAHGGNSWANGLLSWFVCFTSTEKKQLLYASCCVHYWVINKVILGLNYDKKI